MSSSAGPDSFPPLEPVGDLQMHLVYAKPENSAPAVKILHHTLICLARKRIWIRIHTSFPSPWPSTRSARRSSAAWMCAC